MEHGKTGTSATQPAWPFAGGELASHIRERDWSGFALGPPDGWPPLLRSSLDLILGCTFPATLQWGPGLALFYNEAYIPLIGDRHPSALGQPLLEAFPEIHATYSPIAKRVLQGERIQCTDLMYSYVRSGEPQESWFDLSYSPIFGADGKPAGILAIGLETTARRQAQQARAKADMRVQRIMETEGVGMILFDAAKGVVLDANDVFLRMVGYDREDLAGNGLSWRDLTPPEWIAESEKQMERFHETGRVGPYEKEYFRKDGTRRWMLFAGRDLGDGTINEYAIDISDRKQAEKALLQSEKLAAVGRLAASIAHEINNPLEAVTNLLYLAQDSDSREEVASLLSTADHELRRVSVIANQTLRFHRQASLPQPVMVEDLVRTVLTIYEGRLHHSGIEVRLSFRAASPAVCLEGDIRQVLNNLIGNAIDAMSRSGGILTVRSQAVHDWRTGRAGIAITVADTGAGIAKENVDRIFEPFFTTKGDSGTGLGLWISQEVTARHNGLLHLRSSVAQGRSGTVFRLFLPSAHPQLSLTQEMPRA